MESIDYSKPHLEEDSPKIDDIYSCRYEKPYISDMAICLVYFNSMKSKRMLMNYLYTVEKLQSANIPYYTIELCFGEPEIKKAIHVSGKSHMFHKERLCRILEKHVSWWYSKIMFLDADVIFNNPLWYSEVSTLLNTYDVVQPFKKAVWLDITYTHSVTERYTVADMDRNSVYDTKFHPGFAWAFKRSWYKKVGFFDYGITGSGDTLSVAGWLGVPFKENYLQPALQPAFEEFNILSKPKITNSSGTVYHLWHGTRENRKYTERHTILEGLDDVRTILILNKDGVYELLDQSINQKLKEYFISRCDDGF
jgi:hypothetical protein